MNQSMLMNLSQIELGRYVANSTSDPLMLRLAEIVVDDTKDAQIGNLESDLRRAEEDKEECEYKCLELEIKVHTLREELCKAFELMCDCHANYESTKLALKETED